MLHNRVLKQFRNKQNQTYLGCCVDLVQVIDQLCQVLNGVNVVVWWGADEGNTGLGAAEVGDVRRDLLARQLTTLSRLGTLFVCSKKGAFPGGVRGAFKPTSSQVVHHPLRATFDKN